jgi:hypothetical protein
MKRRQFILGIGLLFLGACFSAEVLTPQPSALDLDEAAPTCPGLEALSVSAGPTLSLSWAEASDNVSSASAISYFVYLRTASTSYDLVSPTKIVVGATSTLITLGVAVGQTYTLWIACKDEAGNVFPTGPTNELSVAVADVDAPTPITDLNAGSPTFTSILLTWSPSDDGAGGTGAAAMRYKVYASTSSPVSTGGSPLTTVTGTTSYLHSSLNSNETWYYRVVATDITGNLSSDSNQATNTTSNDTVAPSFSALNLETDARTTSTIDIDWDAASDNVTAAGSLSYRVYRCSGSTTCDPYALAHIATTTAGDTDYSDTGLSPNVTYVYGIRALDARSNISINTDTHVTNTDFSDSGSFYAYPTKAEVNQRLGTGVAIGHVYGPITGGSAYPDLILGAPNASQGGSPWAYTGCIYVFAGIAGGRFATTPSQTICQPGASADGSLGNGRNFGYSIATGDFDGDGATDVAVSSPEQSKVFYFLYSSGSQNLVSGPSITWTAGGTVFGFGICAGNIDGDAYDDLVTLVPTGNCIDGCANGVTRYDGTGYYLVFNNTSGGQSLSPANTGSQVTISTVTPATDVITLGSTAFNVNDVVYYSTTAAVAAPLVTNRAYFVKTKPTGTTLTLSQTLGGATIDITGAGTGTQTFLGPITNSTTPTQVLINAGYTVEANDQHARSCAIGNFDSTTPAQTQLVIGSGETDIAAGNANDGSVVFIRRTGPNAFTAQNSVIGTSPNNLFGDALAAVQTDTGIHELFVGAPNDSSAGTSAGAIFPFVSTMNGANFDLFGTGDIFVGGSDSNTNSFGTAIGVGDVGGYGDGRRDIVGGAGQEDGTDIQAASALNKGNAYLYKNTGSSISQVSSQNNFSIEAHSASTYQNYGKGLCSGDVNNDTFEDVIVGSYGQDYDSSTLTNSTDQGAVYIYYGRAFGEIDFANPDQVIYAPGNLANSYFGHSCVVMDYDGDSKQDLVVGAPGRTSGGVAWRGSVFIYLGTPGEDLPAVNSAVLNIPSALTSGQILTAISAGANTVTMTSATLFNIGDHVRYTTTAGAIGGLVNGTTYVIQSKSTNDVTLKAWNSDYTSAAALIDITGALPGGVHRLIIADTASDAQGFFGYSLAAVDLDSNGGKELIVGAPEQAGASNGSFTDSGRVYVFWSDDTTGAIRTNDPKVLAPPFGAGGTAQNPFLNASNTLQVQNQLFFGTSMAGFKSVSGSAHYDLVVCMRGADANIFELWSGAAAYTDLGICLIYKGSFNKNASQIDYDMDVYPYMEVRYPNALTAQTANIAFFGTAVVNADYDDDGLDDLVVCGSRMRNFDLGVNNAGACYNFKGKSGGGFQSLVSYRGSFPSAANDFYNPNADLANVGEFGDSVLLVDVNNNGRKDLLVGEYLVDNNGVSETLGRDSGRVYINRGDFYP